MASTTLTTPIRRRLSAFARGIARPFTDSRRRDFVTDMLTGLVAAGHVHLTAIARGISRGTGSTHADEKRLSRHLESGYWDASPIAAELLRRSAALVTDGTLIVGDTTDLAKYYARHLEGLGRVHDGSDPEGRTAPGYCVFEAYVRVGTWQLFPLVVEPLKVYAGAATGENAEILSHVLRVHEAAGRKGTWVLDRGFDRRELFGPLVKNAVAFVVRQRGDRTVRTADGRDVSVDALVAEQVCPRPHRWPHGGVSVTVEVWLPEVGPDPFLLVVGWRVPGSERPLVLLVSPAARRPGRTGKWFVRAYHKRWEAELDLRSSKITLGMDVLRCRSPAVVRKEIWAHLLGYNLVRTVMAQVAERAARDPRKVGVAGAAQALAAFAEVLGTASGYESFVRVVLAYRVGNRPDRGEPRALKRRPKPYRPLTVPRAEARRSLLRSARVSGKCHSDQPDLG